MIEHLSYSSISTWLMCPRSWKFRYIEKIPVPTSPALIFGSAVHAVVEAYVVDRSIPMVELWPTAWSKQMSENEGRITWGNDTPEALHNDGIRLLSAADIVKAVDGIQVATDTQGTVIERKIELRVPEVPIPIIGYIDLIDTDGIPHDIKTSSKSWGADKAKSETQPLFYLAALIQAGVLTHQLRFRHVVFVKTKTPQVQVIESKFTYVDVFWLLGLIAEVWKAIESRAFPPNPNTWKCSETWCEYWRMCRGKP